MVGEHPRNWEGLEIKRWKVAMAEAQRHALQAGTWAPTEKDPQAESRRELGKEERAGEPSGKPRVYL